MKKELFALKGTLCYSKNMHELVFMENSYVICENGISAGVFSRLPEKYKDIPSMPIGEPAWIWSF